MSFGALLFVVAAAVFLAFLFRDPRPPRPSQNPSAMVEDAGRILRRMKRLARPTLLLVAEDPAPFSKVGGEPVFPTGVAWPTGPDGALAFLLQVDLAEVRAAGGPDWLPDGGTLYAFHDDRFGAPDQVQVFHFPSDGHAPLQAPSSLPRTWRYRERRVGFRRLTSLPSLDWLGEDVRKIEVSDQELDELADMPDEPFGTAPQHRIGGYPTEIQDEQMALSCEYSARRLERSYGEPVPPAIGRAARQWRMLLQIDSDSDLGMNFADGGRFYVFVREADARTADFSKTVTIFQTY